MANSSYGVITGQRAVGGTVQGNWTRGLSAFDLAKMEGFQGTLHDWLESLKGVSPVINEPQVETDGIRFTLTDTNGEHEIFLPNGVDGQSITVTKSEETADAINVTFSDGSSLAIPKAVSPTVSAEQTEEGVNLIFTDVSGEQTVSLRNGETGPQGEPGREVVMQRNLNGSIYWRYATDDNNWKELINLGELAEGTVATYVQDNPFGRIVDTLPETPLKGVIYVLKEGDIFTSYTADNDGVLRKISGSVSEQGEVFPDYIDAPVKNAKGTNEEQPVELNTLDYGTYTLSGFFSTGEEGSEVLTTADDSVQVTVTKDQVTGEKIAKFETVEDGELWTTVITYDEEGNFLSSQKRKVNAQYWDEF